MCIRDRYLTVNAMHMGHGRKVYTQKVITERIIVLDIKLREINFAATFAT